MKELLPKLKETLFNDQIREITIDYTDLGVDLIFKNDLIKELPIVKTLISVGKTGQLVWERNLINQLISFINGYNSNDIEQEKVLKKIKELKKNPKKVDTELSRIIFLLNRNIENKKSYYLGKSYFAYLDGIIEWDFFCEISEVINRLFLSDIPILLKIYKNNFKKENSLDYNIDRLVSLGLIKLNIVIFKDLEDENLNSKKEKGDNFIEITSLGEKFCEIIKYL